ncbi:hypothetical protein T07_9214 [Trichinella nelsoni]|uniref:Uncharacterized protein n=1 Tax=Trichinella nelsoni TaxID=6336 RepID=A0A0V0S4C9_9BILA|nr:hypothetical protein T07_9214 [Trichinella nelsoni]
MHIKKLVRKRTGYFRSGSTGLPSVKPCVKQQRNNAKFSRSIVFTKRFAMYYNVNELKLKIKYIWFQMYKIL